MKEQQVKYYFTKENKFVIENYNWAKAFSNFFPGIAGKLGIPMWVYYVNRAQGICSFGVKDKNNAILEFLSFNKALQFVGSQGFRTFVKIGDGTVYEPFRKTDNPNILQTMTVSSAELEISEENKDLGLRFNVTYFPIVEEFFPALVRKLEIQNISEEKQKFELVDGLPHIIPAGMNLHTMQVIPRHVEGMMKVDTVSGVPVFRLKQSPADTEQVAEISEGNFYITFDTLDFSADHKKYVVDPFPLFLENENYDFPWGFQKHSAADILEQTQIKQNRTPCAFTAKKYEVLAQKAVTLFSVLGQATADAEIPDIIKLAAHKEYIYAKQTENVEIIESIKDISTIKSNNPIFDEYCKQTFLDNVIRGGIPVIFPTAKGKSTFYVYSRQNGDLERDYHFFVIEPTYYSQGNGHYRSVNQNRRSDTYFFPEIEDGNIAIFMNLIQTDGYNPLEVTVLTYSVSDKTGLEKWLNDKFNGRAIKQRLAEVLEHPFSPGQFLKVLEDEKQLNKDEAHELTSQVLSFCTENGYGNIHEGYWIDHWFYNLDLIDNFLSIYPDKLEELLVNNNSYYFYDDPDIIRPRAEKYVFVNDRIFQYNSVYRDERKEEMINGRKQFPTRMRTEYGVGEVYYTNLLTKLLCIVANRTATLDPFGAGVEMEANKPGWNDSMNGLPGIIGSSLNAALELEKALRFLKESLPLLKTNKIKIFDELYEFISALKTVIAEKNNSAPAEKEFIYWDKSNTLKEKYREQTKYGIGGNETEMTIAEVEEFVDNAYVMVSDIFSEEKRKKVMNPNHVPYTYFENYVTEYEFIYNSDSSKKLNQSGYPLVIAKKFEQKQLPLFLEGPVHYMKAHPEFNKEIYNAVKSSDIYDKKLKMYKVCESLNDAPFEIGRVKAWGSGWIENESVYTHMEYKYFLEILRSGLYDEFYSDMKTAFMPFLDPAVYGRSTLENVSFVVSSAFPDEKMHGQGLQPRLSGVTGEMISMWILMTTGANPFFLDAAGDLCLQLAPALNAEFFTETAQSVSFFRNETEKITIDLPERCLLFKFLGKVITIYHNQKMKNTYGPDGVKVKKYTLLYNDDTKIDIDSAIIPMPYSKDVRSGKVARIDAFLE